MRDRLSVNAAAHLSAQLPELLRGIFYEGWIPAHVPVPHDVPSFLSQFAHESGVSADEAAALAGAVTGAFGRLFSPGQLDHVLAQFPLALRHVLLGIDLAGVLAAAAVFTPGDAERVEELEMRLRALSEAVAVLTRGLEDLPGSGGDDAARAAAAQQAHRILLAEGLTSPKV